MPCRIASEIDSDLPGFTSRGKELRVFVFSLHPDERQGPSPDQFITIVYEGNASELSYRSFDTTQRDQVTAKLTALPGFRLLSTAKRDGERVHCPPPGKALPAIILDGKTTASFEVEIETFNRELAEEEILTP